MHGGTFTYQKAHLKRKQAFVKANVMRAVLNVKSKMNHTEFTVAFRKILSVTAGVL